MAQQNSPNRDRVNLVYRDNETKAEKELPFKILVIGDYTGAEDDRPLDERVPIKVDRGNFGAVMSDMGLELRVNVANAMSDDPEDTLAIHLKFRSLADFTPEWVAEQVPELRAMIEARQGLTELKHWLREGSLVFRMQKALSSPETRAQLRRELNVPYPKRKAGKGAEG